MDCNCNQNGGRFLRVQMVPPPCLNTDCSPAAMPFLPSQPVPATQPTQPTQQMLPTPPMQPVQQMQPLLPEFETTCEFMEQFSIGMAYVPWQQWNETYTIEQGLERGTIFPELDLPFLMGRCR